MTHFATIGDVMNQFIANIEGNSNTIHNLVVNSSFIAFGKNCAIRNLIFNNLTIISNYPNLALMGRAENCLIEGVQVINSIINMTDSNSTLSTVGAIVASSRNTSIINCNVMNSSIISNAIGSNSGGILGKSFSS